MGGAMSRSDRRSAGSSRWPRQGTMVFRWTHDAGRYHACLHDLLFRTEAAGGLSIRPLSAPRTDRPAVRGTRRFLANPPGPRRGHAGKITALLVELSGETELPSHVGFDLIVDSLAVTAASEGDKGGRWTCAVAAAYSCSKPLSSLRTRSPSSAWEFRLAHPVLCSPFAPAGGLRSW